MASIVIAGDTSGSVTLAAPAVAGTTTITLPATSGTLLQSGTTVTEAQGGTGTTVGYYGFKNRIINGAMVIDQRNAGASVTPTDGLYTLDRYVARLSQASKFSVQQSTTAATGFINSLKVTSASSYSVLAGDYFAIQQNIEGLNCTDLGWGTASAKTVTLSFQVYSSLTGTFGGALSNNSQNRSYPFTYSISTANTWTTISVTIAGDTSGTWLTTNSVGIMVFFGLGMGSTYSGTAGAWAAAAYLSATGATSVVGTNGATFYITGVQLETGSTATSFDVRDYGRELIMCQRYAYVWNSAFGENNYRLLGLGFAKTTTRVDIQTYYPVVMRTNPSTTFSAANTLVVEDGPNSLVPSSVSTSGQEINMCNINFTVSGGTQFRPYSTGANNTLTAKIIWSAEL